MLVTEKAAAESNLAETQNAFADQWADLFIVSDVEVCEDAVLYAQAADTALEGVRVLVSEAKGEKCPAAGSTAPTPTAKRACAPAAPLWWPNSPSKHNKKTHGGAQEAFLRPTVSATAMPAAPCTKGNTRMKHSRVKTGQGLLWSLLGILLYVLAHGIPEWSAPYAIPGRLELSLTLAGLACC